MRLLFGLSFLFLATLGACASSEAYTSAGGSGGASASSSSSTSGSSSFAASSSGTGGASQGGSGGGGGGLSCDQGECGDLGVGCVHCAVSSTCAGPYNTCINDTGCVNVASCIDACVDDPICAQMCHDQDPNGAALYDAFVMCVLCDACVSTCGFMGC